MSLHNAKLIGNEAMFFHDRPLVSKGRVKKMFASSLKSIIRRFALNSGGIKYISHCLKTFSNTDQYNFEANVYLLKVNNRNTRKSCEIYSKLTIKTPGRRRRC